MSGGHLCYMCRTGDTLMESDAVRKIGFTGSTRVGKLLFAAAADTVKKVGTVTQAPA